MSLLKSPISITALGSISALGAEKEAISKAYKNKNHYLSLEFIGNKTVWVGKLAQQEKERIDNLRKSDSKYRSLDDSVLYAILASRMAVEQAGWPKDAEFGINIGSSRGATALFEKYHKAFVEEDSTPTLTSPTTTLGNIASWVAHDLRSKGPVISHSITCSTALHALLNGIAWIQGGMTNKFLVGGSEAPLTSFTVAQMQALKIYSNVSSQEPSKDIQYPCRAFDLNKKQNTMVLGEGAASACLEKGNLSNALAKIIGIGYATEQLEHNVSISTDALCFQDSMKMALGEIPAEEIDAIVMHAPGTVKGDTSECNAIQNVFCNKTPFLTTNKWKVGHTFGASGMFSIEMAIQILTTQNSLPVPFVDYEVLPKRIHKVMVNAVGFGGNAVSILLSK